MNERITCACGKTEAVVTPGVTIKSLRCPHCPPPEKPSPKLRLVP